MTNWGKMIAYMHLENVMIENPVWNSLHYGFFSIHLVSVLIEA